jgi:flagellum-specific peptidoglycan hydrolase FlgJ
MGMVFARSFDDARRSMRLAQSRVPRAIAVTFHASTSAFHPSIHPSCYSPTRTLHIEHSLSIACIKGMFISLATDSCESSVCSTR